MSKKKKYITDCVQHQKQMSSNIQAMGFTVKAQRLSRCRPGHRCKLVLACPWCMDRHARHLLRNLLPACKLAQDDADAALASSSSSISCCLSLLSGLSNKINAIDNDRIIQDGQLTAVRKSLDNEASEVLRRLRTISGMPAKGTKRRLRSMRRSLSLRGPIRKKFVLRHLRLAIEELRRESTYCWQVITLTVKVRGNVRGAMRILRVAFSRLVSLGILGSTKVCFKMTEASSTLNQVHIHGFFYGPLLSKEKLSREWLGLTGNFIVDIEAFRYSREESVKRIVNYVHNPLKLPVETKTKFWAENGSRITMNAYGGLRRQLRLVRSRGVWKLPVRIHKGSR
jgi:hypothetical protein